jgi:hypothetical protein
MDRGDWPRSGKRTRHVRVALLVATVVLVLTLVVVGAGGTSLGRHQRSATVATTRATLRSSRLRLVDLLGVLRRPQTQADRTPRFFDQFENGAPALGGTPILPLVRLATTTSWGDKVFLVPFGPLTPKSIAKLPPHLRKRALSRLAHEQRIVRLGIVDDGGGGCCDSVASIEAGRAVLSSGPSPNSVLLVVPDGVAKVTLLLPQAATAVVHGNVAAFVVHQPVENLNINKMIWYGSSGNVVKRIGGGKA